MKTKNEKVIKIVAIFILSWLSYVTGCNALAAESSDTLVTRVLTPVAECTMMLCTDGDGNSITGPQPDGSCKPCNQCEFDGFLLADPERKRFLPVRFLTKEPDSCNYIKDDCSPPCEGQIEAKGYFEDIKHEDIHSTATFVVREWKLIKRKLIKP